MMFLRQLAAATPWSPRRLLALGLAWNRFAPGSLAGGSRASFKQISARGPHLKGAPAGAVSILPAGRGDGRHKIRIIRSGPMNLGLGSMLDSVNWPYLRHTVTIEAAVMAGVVIADIGRRGLRTRRRRRRWPPSRRRAAARLPVATA